MIGLTRFEVMPFPQGEAEAAALPADVRLTVTASPKHGLDRSVQAAIRLRNLGHAVTLHLAARMVLDREHLDRILVALAAADIDDIFVVGGDIATSCGPYSSALELLSILDRHPSRPRNLGIAGYPEGHPRTDERTLSEALQQKSLLANYITTQLCFNSVAIVRWVQSIREAGVSLPVIVGLPGIVDRRKLLEISVRVGVGSSIAFIRSQGGLARILSLSSRTLETLHRQLSPLVADGRTGIDGFHYFTFNRLLDTWRWERAHSLETNAATTTEKRG